MGTKRLIGFQAFKISPYSSLAVRSRTSHEGQELHPSKRLIRLAKGGVSVLALTAAFLAIQPSTARAGGPVTPAGPTYANAAAVAGTATGVLVNSGTLITTFSNSGTIAGTGSIAVPGSTGYGVVNNGSISSLSNTGTITGVGIAGESHATLIGGTGGAGYGLSNSGSIGSISISGGLISGTGATGGTGKGTTSQLGGGTGGLGYGLSNSGSITSLDISGGTVIGTGGVGGHAHSNFGGGTGGSGYGLSNSGTIDTVNITGGSIAGIGGAGGSPAVGLPENFGGQGGSGSAFDNSGTIGSLSIAGATLSGIGGNGGDARSHAGLGGDGYGLSNSGLITSVSIANSTVSGTGGNGGNATGINGGLGGTGIGISNSSIGTITFLSNSGTIKGLGGNAGSAVSNSYYAGNGSGLSNSGSIGSIGNSGLIEGTGGNGGNATSPTGWIGNGGYGTGIENIFGQIGTLSNSGEIIGTAGASGSINGTVGSNLGRGVGVENYGGTIGSFVNTGSISGNIGVDNFASAVITNLNNDVGGTITGSTLVGTISFGTGVNNTGVIHNLINSGSIYGDNVGVNNSAVYTYTHGNNFLATIGTLSNLGTITAGNGGGTENAAIRNVGVIETLSNMGSIGGGTIGINNTYYGFIGTLLNAQGGASAGGTVGALTYTGNLPTTYLEYVTSTTLYGQLAVSQTDSSYYGTIGSFAVAAGSSLANGTYASVITGVGTIQGTTTEIRGSLNGVGWELLDMGGDIWDLIVGVTGPDSINTLLELGNSRDQILSAMRNRAALTNMALDYDCLSFDKNGVCVSVNLRASSVADQTETAGVIIGAVKLSPTVRLGAFLDYAGRQNSIGGIAYGSELPTVGGFVGYTEKPDGTGLQGRVATAFHTGRVTITRGDTLSSTEAGSGTADLTTWGVSGELGYGYALAAQFRATPFVGLRYGDAERSGYTEGTSDAVSYPISYEAYYQHLTTGMAGVRFNGMITDAFSYQFGGGIEYDLLSDANAFSGTSAIAGLETFALDNTAGARRFRVNGSLGLGYAITPSTKLTTSVSVRQEAYTSQLNTNVMIGVQSGF